MYKKVVSILSSSQIFVNNTANLCDVTDHQFYESPVRCILNATCVTCSLL